MRFCVVPVVAWALAAAVSGVAVQPTGAQQRMQGRGARPADAWYAQWARRQKRPTGTTISVDYARLPTSARAGMQTAPCPARLEDGALESSAVLRELEREAHRAGEHLVRAPSVLRGFCGGTGQPTERRAVLTHVESLQLIQRAWFFLTASDARRELQAEAVAAAGDALYARPVSNEAVLLRMRRASRFDGTAAARSATSAAAIARAVQQQQHSRQLPTVGKRIDAPGAGTSRDAGLGYAAL